MIRRLGEPSRSARRSDDGVDNGTPVSNNYKAKDHFPFTGQIDKVVITLTGEDADQAKEINNTELVD